MNYLEDDDDDIHFCLRCRRTILGLGAYVEHRSQKNCHLQTEENTSREPSSVTNSSNSIQELMKISENLGTETTKSVSDVEAGLKANDFFSLLELQSSSKTGGAAPVLDLATKEQKNSGLGVVTRSRRKGGGSRERKDEENAKKVVGEKKKRKKKERRGGRKRNKVEESEVCQVELLEGSVRSFSKEVDIFVENCAKEVNVNNTNILMNVDELDKSSEKVFELFSDFPSTSSPFPLEEVVPFTCDKTTLDDHEIAEYEEDEEEEVPPFRSYGGKWKPGSSPSVHQQRNESFASMSWTDQEANNSLLSAAGTSWRSEPHTSIDLEEKSTTVTQKQPSIPPPGHTRGKWLPSSSNDDPSTARRAGNRVQYWCGVCNRRLSSRRLYERHVASPLHTRRTRHERQLDEDYLQHRAVPVRDATTSRRVRRMPCKLQEAIAARMVVRGVRTTVKKDGKKSSKTIHCEVCDLQVARHQIGKHLVSRFHLRLAAAEPDAARRMTQSHATAVARQAPFRCSMCRFYCNTQESMLLHWASKMHADRDAEVPGRYWCAFCKHFSDTSSGMELHLRSEQHKDVISVVNRSFPIEIQKLVALKCETAGCERIFRYNSQLRMHSKLTGHLQSEGSASDSYQDRMRCSRCTFVANSERRLQKHMIVRHKSKNFFCSDCKMRFASKEEAVKHRRSEAHRYTALRRREAPSQLARACPHCSEILGDVMQLKQHLTQSHPDEAHRCAKCGASFTLKQELSRHVRSGCQGLPQKSTTDDDVTMPSTSEASAGSEYSCTKCNFTSSSKSELLYHVALHHPITSNEPGKDGSKVPKITCPTCSRLIRKDCLRKHLKTHTGEKRHVCKTCNAAFSRRDVLTKHCRVMHAELERCTVCDVICANAFSLRRHLQSHCKDREKNEHCAECGMAFYDKIALKQHLQIHIGKTVECHYADCVFTCRSEAELANHLRTHLDLRSFSCEQCQYSAKTKAQLMRHQKIHAGDQTKQFKCLECDFETNTASHLKRHSGLHTGIKPYKCPHCSYTCSLQENLRKHVLSTKKHVGKFLYACQESGCNFEGNSAKDFRVHLVKLHGSKPMDATAHIAGLHRAVDNSVLQDVVSSNSNPEDTLLSQSIATSSHSVNILSPLLGSAVPLPLQDDPAHVSAEPSTSSDDIIFIQIPPSDTAYDVPFFSPSEHQLFSETLTASSSAHAQSGAIYVEQELVIIDESATIELVSENE